MKYKVLLLLLFIALAYSRVLKRSKTKHGETYTVNVKKLPDGYPADSPYYIFCTDDFFAKHNADFKKQSNDYNVGMKDHYVIKNVLEDLLICIYNLNNDEKITFTISKLISMSYD
jgi:hypothetical protein